MNVLYRTFALTEGYKRIIFLIFRRLKAYSALIFTTTQYFLFSRLNILYLFLFLWSKLWNLFKFLLCNILLDQMLQFYFHFPNSYLIVHFYGHILYILYHFPYLPIVVNSHILDNDIFKSAQAAFIHHLIFMINFIVNFCLIFVHYPRNWTGWIFN